MAEQCLKYQQSGQKTLILKLSKFQEDQYKECLNYGLEPQQAKAIEPLNPFCFAIEKRNLSKYSSALTKKGEREKKTMLVYRGRFALLASFYLHFILKRAA